MKIYFIILYTLVTINNDLQFCEYKKVTLEHYCEYLNDYILKIKNFFHLSQGSILLICCEIKFQSNRTQMD